MLPFLKQKQAAGVAVTYRKPDENQDVGPETSASALEACAIDMMEAMEGKDAKRFAAAFQAAIECLESAPDETVE